MKLSQTALGKKIGVSHSAISTWYNNSHSPTPKHIEKLAAVFGIPPIFLYLSEQEVIRQCLASSLSAELIIHCLTEPQAEAVFIKALHQCFDDIRDLEAASEAGIKAEFVKTLTTLAWRSFKNEANKLNDS